jgi:ABC-2 type transport system ATP-binding protein
VIEPLGDEPDRVVRVADLMVERGEFVLRVHQWDVRAGDVLAIVGANGGGKTTFIQTLSGFLLPTSGECVVGNHRTEELGHSLPESLGVVPDELFGFPEARVEEHLEFLAAMHPTWDTTYAEELVVRLDIPRRTALKKLSKGNKAKVAFVSVEAYRPPVLVLDEPTSGLDPAVRQQFLAVISSIVNDRPERAVVFSTHLLEDAAQVATALSLVRRGTVYEPVRGSPMHAWVRLPTAEMYAAIAILFGVEGFA